MTKEEKKELKEFLKKPENKELRSFKRKSTLFTAGTVATALITSDLLWSSAEATKDNFAHDINAGFNAAYEHEKYRLANGDITQEEYDTNIKELEISHEKALKKNRRNCRIRQIGSTIFVGMAGGAIAGNFLGCASYAVDTAMEEAKSASKNKTKAQQDEIIKNFIKGKKSE